MNQIFDTPEFALALLDSTDEGVVFCDSEGKLFFVNQKAQDYFGGPFSASNIEELDQYYDLFYPDKVTPVDNFHAPIYRAYRGETFQNFEIFAARKDNTSESLLFICNGRPILGAHKKFLGAIVTFRDVTQIRLSEQLADLHKALSKSENRFRILFEQSPLSIQLFDCCGKIILVNTAFKHLWQFSDEFIESYFMHNYNILEDEILNRKGILPEIQKAFQGEIVSIEALEYDPSENELPGRSRWVKGLVYPLKDGHGKVNEVVIIHQDVSTEYDHELERNRLLLELSSERSKFKSILQQMPIGVMVADNPHGDVSLYNDTIKKMFGNIETARQLFQKPLNDALTGIISSRQEYHFTQDGIESTFVAGGGPVSDSDGNVTAGIIIAVDVSERKLNDLNQSFLTYVKSLLTSTIDYDQVIGKIAESSIPYLADGCLIDLIEGNRIQRIITKHSDPHIERLMYELMERFPVFIGSPQPTARVIRSGVSELLSEVDEKTILEHSLSNDHADLIKRIGVTSHIAIPLIIHGKIIGALNLLMTSHRKKYDQTDISVATELSRHAAIAIDNAKLFKNTQDALKLRDDFISTASHELRTPITSLNLQIEVLNDLFKNIRENSAETDLIKKFLNRTHGQLDRLNRLVEDMLDISRIRMGKLSFNPRNVDLTELVNKILDNFYEIKNSIEVNLIVNPEESIQLICDPDRIEQVITNLFTNAVRYGENKPIDISLEQTTASIRIMVKDRGRGIHKNDHERIFNRFERISSPLNISGLGLGLFISKQIVDEHQGKIWVESELGQGARFFVEFQRI